MEAISEAPRRRSSDEDIQAIQSLGALDTMLQVLRRTTGLRVAMVVRVQPGEWTCCAVLDEAGFGIRPGDQLEFATTY